ncbi:glycine cleavage system aminomethyltransferase GcvT, partial [Staphylococcus aureus]
VSAMKLGKAKYSLVLAESGGIVDDVIVYRTGEKYYLVIANASNRDAVAAAFAQARDTWTGGALPEVDDVTDRVALVALQGPRARG